MAVRLLPLACLLVLTAPAAAAPAAPAPAPITISATPTIVTLLGASTQSIHVTNPSGRVLTVGVSLGNYDITSSGRVLIDPAQPPNRTAKAWLDVSPATLRLGPGGSADVTVSSHPPKRAEPGDHHALVLLAARSPETAEVGIRTRIGIGVLVRMPGDIVRRLAVAGLSAGPARTLTLRLANRGNVNERLAPGQLTISLRRAGRTVTVLRTRAVDLLAATSQTVVVPYRGTLRGRVTALVRVQPTPARGDGPGITASPAPVIRTFSVRL